MSSREHEPIFVSPQRAARESEAKVRAEEIANQLASASGTPMVASVRQQMESRFAADFSNVRVHHDDVAAAATSAFGARALTIGRHIGFNKGEYAPATSDGQRLLAHELAHVEQQRHAGAGRASLDRDANAEREARVAGDRVARGMATYPTWQPHTGSRRIQLDDEKTKTASSHQAGAKTPAGVRVTFVLRAPDDAYTRDVTDFVTKTLNEKVIEVDNLQEAADYLSNYTKTNKTKVSEVRIIGHGSTAGGIKMTPKGETGRRFVSPQELEAMAADDKLKAKASGAMAEGATVEFWGCYIGGKETSTKAVSEIFGSDVKAIEHTLRTTHDTFARPADKGEKGEELPGRKDRFMTVVSTDEIDSRVKEGNKQLGQSFNSWLVAQAKILEAGGDLPAQPDDAARIATMRELFNRSGGKIKRLQISAGGTTVQRTDKDKWLKQWKTKKK
jgi:hypothetical protein